MACSTTCEGADMIDDFTSLYLLLISTLVCASCHLISRATIEDIYLSLFRLAVFLSHHMEEKEKNSCKI